MDTAQFMLNKVPPHSSQGLAGDKGERKGWALLVCCCCWFWGCFFFILDYESTFGGACIICAKTQQMNSINGYNMWLGSS